MFDAEVSTIEASLALRIFFEYIPNASPVTPPEIVFISFSLVIFILSFP